MVFNNDLLEKKTHETNSLLSSLLAHFILPREFGEKPSKHKQYDSDAVICDVHSPREFTEKPTHHEQCDSDAKICDVHDITSFTLCNYKNNWH